MGCRAVIEGITGHRCEYVTVGYVVVLGKVGQNVVPRMTSVLVHLLDEDNTQTTEKQPRDQRNRQTQVESSQKTSRSKK